MKKVNKILITFIYLLSFSSWSFAQSIDTLSSINNYLELLASNKFITLNSTDNLSNDRFTTLLSYRAEDIALFIEDDNPYKAAFVILALNYKKQIDFNLTLDYFTYDSRVIFLRERDAIIHLGELVLHLILREKKEKPDFVRKVYVNLINQEIKPVFYRFLLLSTEPYEEIYLKLISFYSEKKIHEALIPISKYCNKEVVNLVKRALDSNHRGIALQALEYLNDESFIPELQKQIMEYALKKGFYGGEEYAILKILVSYQKQDVYVFLNSMLEHCKKKYKRRHYRGVLVNLFKLYPPPENITLPENIRALVVEANKRSMF